MGIRIIFEYSDGSQRGGRNINCCIYSYIITHFHLFKVCVYTPNAGEKFSLNKQTNKTNKQTCLYNLIGSDLRMAGSLLPFLPAPAGQPSETVAGA